MDFATQPHTSFIPKAPLAETRPSGYRTRSVSIGMLVSVIVFVATLALSAGVYLYGTYADQNLASKKDQLQKIQDAFEPATITELERLDMRLSHTSSLLSRHVAYSALFAALSGATMQNVQFRSFTLEATLDGGTEVHLNGIAKSYASVALQSDVFNKTKGFKNPIFSQLALDASGNVAFTVTADLDPSVFSYEGTLVGADTSVVGADASSSPNAAASSQ